MSDSRVTPEATIFVVVTHYRTPKDTEDTVLSLQASSYPHLRICVIDNGSGDGSGEYLRKRFPDILVMDVPTNEGVSRAYNRGIRKAWEEQAGYILILNSDVELEHRCLEELVHAAGSPARPVMLAPLMYYYQPRDRMWFAGGRIDWCGGESTHCLTGAEFHALPMPERFITACAMFLTREASRRAGLYDERFFMYWDDTDYSVAAVRQGVQLQVVEKAVLWHKISSSSGGVGKQISPFHAYQILRSSLLFWRKHLGFWPFHRRWCAGHLGKWVNDLPGWWTDPERRASAESIMDALWYFLTWRKVPLQRPSSPPWFRYLMRTRPWVVAELMAFRWPWSRFGGS